MTSEFVFVLASDLLTSYVLSIGDKEFNASYYTILRDSLVHMRGISRRISVILFNLQKDL